MSVLSIITICYNDKNGLELTIKSVAEQWVADVEYIVIDGGSHDGTLEIIKNYEKYIAYWVSEPDRGIYDAMNKGVGCSHGQWIWFLNAGDYLEPGAIEAVLREIRSLENGVGGFYGKMRMFGPDIDYVIDKRNLQNNKQMVTFSHLATIVNRCVFNEIGCFDDQLRICSDYDFFVRAVRRNVDFRYIDATLVNMRLGGVSDSPKYHIRRLIERYKVDQKHYGEIKALLNFFYNLLSRSARAAIKMALMSMGRMDLLQHYYDRKYVHN